MVETCEELVARGIPVTYRDRVCELCGADILSERAILCRRRRIEIREAQMRDAELRAVLPAGVAAGSATRDGRAVFEFPCGVSSTPSARSSSAARNPRGKPATAQRRAPRVH